MIALLGVAERAILRRVNISNFWGRVQATLSIVVYALKRPIVR